MRRSMLSIVILSALLLGLIAAFIPLYAQETDQMLEVDVPVTDTVSADDTAEEYWFANANDEGMMLAFIDDSEDVDIPNYLVLNVFEAEDEDPVAMVNFHAIASWLCLDPGTYHLTLDNLEVQGDENYSLLIVEGCSLDSIVRANALFAGGTIDADGNVVGGDLSVSINGTQVVGDPISVITGTGGGGTTGGTGGTAGTAGTGGDDGDNTICLVANTSLRVYNAPFLTPASIIALQADVIGRTADNTWLLVSVNGELGYVPAVTATLSAGCDALPISDVVHDVVGLVDGVLAVVDTILPTRLDLCLLNNAQLNVHVSPQLSAGGFVAANAEIHALGRTSDGVWLLVNVNGQVGYVTAITANLSLGCASLPLINITHDAVDLVDGVLTTVATVVAQLNITDLGICELTDTVWLYSAASLDADVSIYANARVNILGYTPDGLWLMVNVNGQIGYIITLGAVIPQTCTGLSVINVAHDVVALVDGVLETVGSVVIDPVSGVVSTVTTVVDPVTGAITEVVTTALPGAVTTTVPGLVLTTLPGVVTTTIPGVVGTVIPGVATAIPGVIETVVPGVETLIPGVATAIPGVIETVVPGVETLIPGVATAIPGVIETVVPIVPTLVPIIPTLVPIIPTLVPVIPTIPPLPTAIPPLPTVVIPTIPPLLP